MLRYAPSEWHPYTARGPVTGAWMERTAEGESLAMASGHPPGRVASAMLPTGTVAFLFTDIEGSTQRWDAHGVAMAEAVRCHDSLGRATITARHGHIFKTQLLLLLNKVSRSRSLLPKNWTGLNISAMTDRVASIAKMNCSP